MLYPYQDRERINDLTELYRYCEAYEYIKVKLQESKENKKTKIFEEASKKYLISIASLKKNFVTYRDLGRIGIEMKLKNIDEKQISKMVASMYVNFTFLEPDELLEILHDIHKIPVTQTLTKHATEQFRQPPYEITKSIHKRNLQTKITETILSHIEYYNEQPEITYFRCDKCGLYEEATYYTPCCPNCESCKYFDYVLLETGVKPYKVKNFSKEKK